MIISCEKCHTRFKLNESRIKPSGTRLRCSKCQHTFELKPPLPPAQDPANTQTAAAADSPTDPRAQADASFPGLSEADRVDRAVLDALFGTGESEGADSDSGSLAGRADDLFGADDALSAGAPGSNEASGADSLPTRERSEDFDWDHLSFTEERLPGSEDAPGKSEPKPFAQSEESPLELMTDRGAITPGKNLHPWPVQPAQAPPLSTEISLDLDRGPAKTGGRRSEPREAEEPLRGHEIAIEAAPKRVERQAPAKPERGATPVLGALPFGRPGNRAPRAVLALPKIPTLVAACILGIAVATTSTLTIYAPLRSGRSDLRVVGNARPEAKLSLGDLRGRTVQRTSGRPLYIVTGKARWSAPPGGSFTLEGVLVAPDGLVLQRRPARIGPPPGDTEIRFADPLRFTALENLPDAGETPFTIFFTPEPGWRAEVRFEIRAGR
jgi:predicted Zn finger-like uncharacterized protein